MKTMFTVRYSEDGSPQKIFRNLSSVIKEIETSGYKLDSIASKSNLIKYNPTNLRKEFKRILQEEKQFAYIVIECSNGSSVAILECPLI